MPNRQLLEEAARIRQRKRPAAQRAHRRYQYEIPWLIRQLDARTQAEYDRAYGRLAKMGDTIVPELLDALADPTLDAAAEDIVSLLGQAGDPRAVPAVWDWFQANLNNAGRASGAMLSLAVLGDARALPYVREALNLYDEEMVISAASSLNVLGEMEDIDGLRVAHRRFLGSPDVRAAVATAIVSILGQVDKATLDRTLGQIEASPADRALWTDIGRLMKQLFG